MNKDSKLVTVVSIVIVTVAVVLLGMFIRNTLTGSDDDNESTQTKGGATKVVGSTLEDPIHLSKQDMSLDGIGFADKYKGKFVSFNGLLQGTSTLNKAPKAHTTLLYGDDVDEGSLADGSLFWITAGASTFSEDLKDFATDNNSPYETGDYPKVLVVAKVNGFDEATSAIQLDPIANVDGKSPSVKQR